MCVRITKPNRAANWLKSVLLCTERLTVSHRKRMVEKVLLPYGRSPSNQITCSRTLSHGNLIRLCGRAQHSWDLGPECNSQKVHYHAARNKFERFRGFSELISRFEFEFCRCVNYFFEGFEFFGVQSSITHNVAVHVPVLWPVCAHTIPFRMLWCP